MAIYAVKYNPSLTYIPGATQVGNLAVAIGDVDYSTGGWVAGVSDDNGYVIYSDTTSLGLTGRTTGGGTGTASSNMPTFYRSGFKTDDSLIQLINRIPGNTQTFNNINDAKAWLSATGHTNILGGTYSGGGGGGATGSGSWYFYAAEGDLGENGPPTTDGQAIFTDNLPAGGTNVTFNPNKSSGVNFLNFHLQDSAGTDYTTQFTNLQNNGGTVSVIQNGIIATYILTSPGMAFIQSGPGFVAINADAATQTVNAASPFVYGDPISISFS